MSDLNEQQLAAQLAEEAMAVPPEEAPAPTLERMQALAAEVNDIDERIVKNQQRIDELNARRQEIVTKELVDMMDATHIPMLQVGDRKFKAEPYYKAVIPAENPEPGLDWLEDNDAGDLIKTEVIASFPRGCEAEAVEAYRLLRERFQMADTTRKRTVHWMTLTKWLKELHQSHDMNKIMPPLDIIGGIIGRIVKISKIKE
jgi:hypothetical protein